MGGTERGAGRDGGFKRDGMVFDVVGIGALNLDYIVSSGADAGGVDPATAGAISDAVRRLGITSEPGIETAVDARAIRGVLAEAEILASPIPLLGGSAYNAVRAMSLANAGLKLGFVGVAGEVPLAHHLSIDRQLEKLGVDHSFVRDFPGTYCGICFSYPEQGDRTLLTHAGANAHMADFIKAEFDAIVHYLAQARIVHVTSFLDDLTAAVLVALLREVRKVNPGMKLSFDPGHVWSTNRTPAIDELVAMSDYLLLNNREFRELASLPAESGDLEAATGILRRADSEQSALVVKRPDGILVYRQAPAERSGGTAAGDKGAGADPVVVSDFYRQTPLASDEIEDATGAGDVFAAGLLIVLTSDELQVEAGARLGMQLASHKLRHVGLHETRFADVVNEFISSLESLRFGGDGVFISHGGHTDWHSVKHFLESELRLPVQYFEAESWGGRPVTDALTKYLDTCGYAICVLTAEDRPTGGVRMARQNVLHEVGLFQGRYGFDRVVVIAEEACDYVPRAGDGSVLRYRQNVAEVFGDLEIALREKGLVGGAADL